MVRRLPVALLVAVVLGLATIWYVSHIPDLPPAKAAELIEQAPEFNRYARLVKVQNLWHYKGSMHTMSEGEFTFQYLNAPAGELPIRAKADFRYWEGAWHLNEFEYGSQSEWRRVGIADNSPKK